MDAKARGGQHHLTHELRADLVAKAARTAMDADYHGSLAQAETGGDWLVENLGDLLNLEIVIAGAEP